MSLTQILLKIGRFETGSSEFLLRKDYTVIGRGKTSDIDIPEIKIFSPRERGGSPGRSEKPLKGRASYQKDIQILLSKPD